MANKETISTMPMPFDAEGQMTDKQLDNAIDMYSADLDSGKGEKVEKKAIITSVIEFENGKDPVEYSEEQEKGKEQKITKKAARKILAFQERKKELNEELKSAKKKDIGFKLINLFSRVA